MNVFTNEQGVLCVFDGNSIVPLSEFLTSGDVQDWLHGAQPLSTTPLAVTDVLRLTANLANFTESGNGTSGWTYTSTSGATWGGGLLGVATANLSVAAGVDGGFEMGFDTIGSQHEMQMNFGLSGGTAANQTLAEYGARVNETGILYTCQANSYVATSLPSAGSILAGDRIRMRRIGSTIQVDRVRAGVVTLGYVFTGVSTAKLYIGVAVAGPNTILSNLRSIGAT